MNPRRALAVTATLFLAVGTAISISPRSALASPTAAAAAEPNVAEATKTATPIKHFVTLMQENHSFDNYFGTYPGADGIPPNTCMPVRPDEGGECIKPFPVGDQPITDLGHTSDVFDRQYRDGQMDGFISAFERRGDAGNIPMGYYDDKDIAYYWNLADDFVLFDRFFTSARAGSVWNHFFWVTGAPGNAQSDTLRTGGMDDVPTIFDRLQAAGVSWKFYVQNYDPSVNYRTPGDGDRASQIVWVPLLNYNRFIDDPELNKHIVSIDQYYEDLNNGTLPAVSFIVPSGASEHPPGSIQSGQRFVRTLISELMRSSAWSSSAFMWTYDDWGGWYDHVKPPQVDQYGYGFRAPALLVSAFAKPGYIDNTELDFTSMLKFIEHNWGVDPLAKRDAAANNFLESFDFNAPARSPTLLSNDRASAVYEPAKSNVVYATYGWALALPSLVLLGGGATALISRRKLRRASAP